MKRLLIKLTVVLITAGLYMACSSRPSEESDAKLGETLKETDLDQEKETAQTDESQAVFEGPGEMIPKKVDGFEISSNPRYFGPDNLYDLINGGAEIYAEFGLKKMVTVDYRSKAHEGISVTVEVYDQGSLLGAFGRMARFLTGRTDLKGIGEGLPKNLVEKGMFGGTDLVFYKDRYLVHVTLLDESPSATAESMTKKSKEILPGFAEAVAKKIESDSALPAVFQIFPKENRVERSEAWDPTRLAGLGELGSGYSYRYTQGEANWILFATSELKDAKGVQAKIEEKSPANKGNGRYKTSLAGSRIVGFQTFDEKWPPDQQKIVEKQVVELVKVVEGR